MSDIVYKYKGNLYINITNRCNNACVFCNKDKLQKLVKSDLILEKEPSVQEVVNDIKQKIDDSIKEIVFCGIGEPLLRFGDVLEIIKEIRKFSKLPIRVNTSGTFTIIQNEASRLKKAGLTSINISLNAFSEKDYNRICRPTKKNSYQRVLKLVSDCKNAGVDVIVSFIREYINDEDLNKFKKKYKVKIRIRELIR